MDIPIILTVLSSFAIFVILQIVVFRRIPRRQVLSWMVTVFLAAGIATSVSSLFFFHSASFDALLFFLFISWLLYGLLSLIYILAVFGIIESSIRIRLLAEIVRSGRSGITLEKIYQKYNREIIVKKRLERFLTSGDISYDGKRYRIARRFSPFFLPGAAFSFLWTLYRG